MALFISPWEQYTDANGNPGSGYLLYFYTTLTTTPITIYSDAAFGTPQANPAVADAAGQWPTIYVNAATYKVVMKTAAGVTVRTADPVAGNLASGPTSSTDNAIARFDGATGKLIQNSGVIIDDSNNMSAVGSLAVVGSATVGNDLTITDDLSADAGTFTGTVTSPLGVFTALTGGALGDDAAVGKIGEVISNSATGISLVSATAKTVTSISITAGDWDIYGNIGFASAVSTSMTSINECISLVNNTLDITTGRFAADTFAAIVPGNVSTAFVMPSLAVRMSVSSSTPVYLVARASFTVSTLDAFGQIFARRRR